MCIHIYAEQKRNAPKRATDHGIRKRGGSKRKKKLKIIDDKKATRSKSTWRIILQNIGFIFIFEITIFHIFILRSLSRVSFFIFLCNADSNITNIFIRTLFEYFNAWRAGFTLFSIDIIIYWALEWNYIIVDDADVLWSFLITRISFQAFCDFNQSMCLKNFIKFWY